MIFGVSSDEATWMSEETYLSQKQGVHLYLI